MGTKVKQRSQWVDICKAIMIYVVVVVHCDTIHSLNILIHAFVLQQFFLFSGYFYNENRYKKLSDLVKSRFYSLIVPYMIFGAGLFVFWNVCVFVMGKKHEMQGIDSLLKSMFWENTTAEPFGVVQYFLTALFVCEIVFWCVCTIGQYKINRVAVGVCVVAVIACVFPVVANFRLPWAADSALAASVFYGVGWIMKKTDFEGKVYGFVQKSVLKTVMVIIALMAIAVPLSLINDEVNIRNAIFRNGFLFYLDSLMLSFVVILIGMIIDIYSKKRTIPNLLAIAGENTLVVLLLNSTLIRIWEVAIGERMENVLGENIYWLNAFAAFLVVLGGVIASLIIKKYAPFLLGMRKR